MSELFDKQVNAQEEKNFQGLRKLLQAHEKVHDENEETKKQTRKHGARITMLLMEEALYRVLTKNK